MDQFGIQKTNKLQVAGDAISNLRTKRTEHTASTKNSTATQLVNELTKIGQSVEQGVTLVRDLVPRCPATGQTARC